MGGWKRYIGLDVGVFCCEEIVVVLLFWGVMINWLVFVKFWDGVMVEKIWGLIVDVWVEFGVWILGGCYGN